MGRYAADDRLATSAAPTFQKGSGDMDQKDEEKFAKAFDALDIDRDGFLKRSD
ncbi:hypothetical protein ACTMTI_27000 [Nonomuraea sp. H19]|uniref:hypothetical protein n=1 Tax=Nonomuraea sp. H19 TaxID=3452206 RepID=UPI003F88BFE2